EFHFLGFLPERPGARRTRLEELAAAARGFIPPRTLIFYEAPHRILDTLADLEAAWGAKTRIALAREMTKMHEEFLRGTAADVRRALAEREQIRGEIVLMVEAPPPAVPQGETETPRETVAARLARIQAETGADEKEALKRLARELGRSKSEVYREFQRERGRRH